MCVRVHVCARVYVCVCDAASVRAPGVLLSTLPCCLDAPTVSHLLSLRERERESVWVFVSCAVCTSLCMHLSMYAPLYVRTLVDAAMLRVHAAAMCYGMASVSDC